MRIDVFTIFPSMVDDFAGHSLLGKAQESGLLDLRVHDLRAATTDPHRSVDDAPFGGGAGMVLMAEPIFAAFFAYMTVGRGLSPMALCGAGLLLIANVLVELLARR